MAYEIIALDCHQREGQVARFAQPADDPGLCVIAMFHASECLGRNFGDGCLIALAFESDMHGLDVAEFEGFDTGSKELSHTVVPLSLQERL